MKKVYDRKNLILIFAFAAGLLAGCSTVSEEHEEPVQAEHMTHAAGEVENGSLPLDESLVSSPAQDDDLPPDESLDAESPQDQASCVDVMTNQLSGQWIASQSEDNLSEKSDLKRRLRQYVIVALTHGLDGDNVSMYAFVLMQLSDQAATAPAFDSLIRATVDGDGSLREGFRTLPGSFWATHSGKPANGSCPSEDSSGSCGRAIIETAEDAAAGPPPYHCTGFSPN